jgi:murein DD-endopeptidase MepM/ murein hydrolase activator NlpD
MNSTLKLLKLIAVLVFGLTLISFQLAAAQDDEPAGPVYIVKEGDTLFGIALQFGVTVDDLLVANGLDNANQLFIGDQLLIPGLAGVSGVLETRNVPYGNSLRSFSRQYQISVRDLARLNRISSPGELYKGSTLIVPVRAELPQTGARAMLAPGESLLELAVKNNASIWALQDANGYEARSRALPGETIALPGTDGGGPGSLPSPIRAVTITPLVQGETAVMTISTASQLEIAGQFGERPLRFFDSGDQSYIALQGMHALAVPDLYPLTISGTLPGGAVYQHTQMVRMRAQDYIFESITVAPELIDPETTEAESEFVSQLIIEATAEKLWQGRFQVPSPFKDCITSTFGNRRSYNGSAYTFFHGGVDFCGGQETQILAPARGIVVFTGELEVRGNYTLVNHGWGVYSGYMHQLEFRVEPGDVVEPGQVIGIVGSTGRSTGPHLHWEIWANQVLVNPLEWLEASFP